MKALRALLPFFRPYRAQVALGLVLVIASAAIASVIPWLLRRAIDGMRAGDPPGTVWVTAFVMVGTALVAGAMRYGMRELLNGVSRRIETDLRDALFGHLLSLDAGWFGRTRTGEIMARLTNDLGAVRMVAGPAIMYLVNTIAGGIFALVFMLSIDVRLTAASLLPMVLLPIVMVKVGRMIHDRFEAVQSQFGALTTQAQENISGVRVVRAYRQEDAEIRRFSTL